MSDLQKYKGKNFSVTLRIPSFREIKMEGKIQIENNAAFFCQNSLIGRECRDTLGYKNSYFVEIGDDAKMMGQYLYDLKIF